MNEVILESVPVMCSLLLSNVSNYVEHLFIWRILCQLMNEEDDDTNIHLDFHEFISYFYRSIKLSVNKNLSSIEEFIICEYASILSTFDMLDIYRRKCIKAIGRCILVHFGQYEIIIERAFQLIHRIHPSIDTINERYQLITYTLNDIIQRCQNEQFEELTLIQCMTIEKVFIEQEKELELNNTDLKQLVDSLDKIENISLNCQSISTFIDVLLVHGSDILTNINLLNLTSSQLTTQHFLNLFDQQNIEIKTTIVFGLIKLFLSSRLEPNIALLEIILDYRFSNGYRSINQYQRDDITSFFYFFIHSSISNVLLIEELTFDLVSRYLPFVSDNSTIAYKSILIESMCYFCIELLSLPTLPIDRSNEEHSHYHLAINLLESIHNSTNNHTSFIIKSYLNTIKHLQFQYMKKE
ncbi:unnamed protein product [Rotaria sp. Silwood1]|nr:unnamed protein product [Rotaria sp. Silwood1]